MPSIQNPPQCPPSRPFSVGRHTRAWALCVPALLAAWAGPAGAEKADRALDMTILSSPCVVDLAKNTYVCTGNVVITGTERVTGQIVGQGGMAVSGGSGSTISGNMTHSGGTLTSNGIALHSHAHGGIKSGGEVSGGPQ